MSEWEVIGLLLIAFGLLYFAWLLALVQMLLNETKACRCELERTNKLLFEIGIRAVGDAMGKEEAAKFIDSVCSEAWVFPPKRG